MQVKIILRVENVNLSRKKLRVMWVNPAGSTRFTISTDDFLSYHDVVTSVDAFFWNDSINSEIEYIMSNHIWELVDFRLSVKATGCKWLFKKN